MRGWYVKYINYSNCRQQDFIFIVFNVRLSLPVTKIFHPLFHPPPSRSPPVQDIVFQLQRFVSGMSHYYDECYAVLKEADVFPIEVDLSRTMINYGSQSLSYTEDDEEEEGGGGGEEGGSGSSVGRQAENGAEKLIDDE